MAQLLSLAEAEQAVEAQLVVPTGCEDVALLDSLGRCVARDWVAATPWPTADRSAMDGFAVAATDQGLSPGTELPVAGESLAGVPFAGRAQHGTAIRIMTGGLVPVGFDAVVPVEQTSGFGAATVRFHSHVRRGDHVRRRGSEVTVGQLLLRRGQRIRSAEIGVLAVLGAVRVAVHAAPRVAILSTGDEVVAIDQDPQSHQVRDSNSWALAAQILEAGGRPLRLGVARDDRDSLLAALQTGIAQADLLLTIGGVSKGTHDLVHDCLHVLGVDEVFHGVALKPGKPTFFGVHKGARPVFVFGLPGNPASCFTVFDLLVRPLLARLAGVLDPPVSMRARVAAADLPANRRLQAVPVSLEVQGTDLQVRVAAMQPSGDPFAMLVGDGYALIPADADPQKLREVEVRPYAAGWRVR